MVGGERERGREREWRGRIEAPAQKISSL